MLGQSTDSRPVPVNAGTGTFHNDLTSTKYLLFSHLNLYKSPVVALVIRLSVA
jgi:hypothetical protein